MFVLDVPYDPLSNDFYRIDMHTLWETGTSYHTEIRIVIIVLSVDCFLLHFSVLPVVLYHCSAILNLHCNNSHKNRLLLFKTGSYKRQCLFQGINVKKL